MSNKCRCLSRSEVEALLAAVLRAFTPQVLARNLCMLTLQSRTGFRISEILSLRLSDVVQGGRVVDYVRVSAKNMKGRRRFAQVALDEAALSEVRRCFPDYNPETDQAVVRRLTDRPRAKSREVPLHPEARKAIEVWVRIMAQQGYQRGDVPLFVSRQRSREGDLRAINRRQAWRIMRQLRDLCGMQGPVGTHSMRKAFAQGLLNFFGEAMGKDGARALLLVQAGLGHANINETMRYLEVGRDDLRRGILQS